MKLRFLGTRGYIEAENRRHRRHSSLFVSYKKSRIIIDHGADWAGRLRRMSPDAVFITHAHPDHAFGLEAGADCPVYATADAWETLRDFPVADQREIPPRTPVAVGDLTVEAFPVIHSLRAPAVGYRITGGRRCLFYVPDVIDIHDRAAALADLRLYIGDGSSLTESLVRRRGDKLFGHTTVRAQLGWCAESGVPEAVFTHCGTEIVTGDERRLRRKLETMADQRGVTARIAHDGLEMVLR